MLSLVRDYLLPLGFRQLTGSSWIKIYHEEGLRVTYCNIKVNSKKSILHLEISNKEHGKYSIHDIHKFTDILQLEKALSEVIKDYNLKSLSPLVVNFDY